ncbi:MAG: 50S ribosomal protein L25 [Verrucomicrobia bacterium]|nr:50S ribosomal protein L25 [Verrucomicrobiota bacterium]MCF7708391.1 50S ribosomal protein L25 [Verrucomicrobiota bacterium]
MKSVPLTVYPRTLKKRIGAKKIRDAGRIPAVTYSRGQEAQPLEVGVREIDKVIQHSLSENVLVEMSVEGDDRSKRLVLLQEVQHHPLSGKILHVDFHEVAEDQKVTITVPVEGAGEAVGVKTSGGVLEHVLFKMRITGYPKDLPEIIRVDVSNLDVGEIIHIGDIPLPEGVEAEGDASIPVFTVAASTVREEEAEEAAESEEIGAGGTS